MRFLPVILLLLLFGCSPGAPPVLREGPSPDSPPEIYNGWQDGCKSGISAYGNDIYKNFYSFKMDSKMLNNKSYYNYWQDGYTYCRQWINSYLSQGLLGQEYSPDLRDERTAKEGSGLVPPFLGW